MKKRVIAFLLTLVMCVSLAVPAGAKIQEGTLDGDGLHVGDTTPVPTPPPYVPPVVPPTTYKVNTPADVEGGKITVSPTSAASGSTVTITVTPDEGYEIEGVTVTDANGKTVTTTDVGGGKYTFTMPGSSVTVGATFKKVDDTPEPPTPPVWENPFKDVKESDWFFDAVKYVNQNGLMVGDKNGRFNPRSNLTRAEFAQILYKKEGSPSVTWTAKFPDVKESDWFAKQIIWATNEGILAGYANGKAGPNDHITREQLVSLLWRYEGRPAPTMTTLNFPDANKVSSYAKEALLWAVEKDIISGRTNGELDPKGNASRGEAAQMLMKYYSMK
ncbi:S-layer homology domain-containing protein [Acutalibacter muris]|uniref:S-layer homology domain-containing protein n=1 Tax=Acutalibacter muris TaxID=1796620 RepID=UPI00272BD107|nr:S-layer homology domain-containing protein [Acutalibacter muris]